MSFFLEASSNQCFCHHVETSTHHHIGESSLSSLEFAVEGQSLLTFGKRHRNTARLDHLTPTTAQCSGWSFSINLLQQCGSTFINSRCQSKPEPHSGNIGASHSRDTQHRL